MKSVYKIEIEVPVTTHNQVNMGIYLHLFNKAVLAFFLSF